MGNQGNLAAMLRGALLPIVTTGLCGLLPLPVPTGASLAAQGQTTEHKLVPQDAVTGHHTGNAVAVAGRIAVVGAYRADVGATDTGAVYVFELVAGAWTQTARLTAADRTAGARFGAAVAIDAGGTILVGADGQDGERGAAYVFGKQGGSWAQVARLQAADGQAGDHFGFAVDVDGDTLLVGAWGCNGVTGAAYAFERRNGAWTEAARLQAADGAAVDYFGHTVSVEGDLALIGAPADDDRGTNSGSAYLFARRNGTWGQAAKLLASDGAASDFLARTGALSNGTVVLGARDDDDRGTSSGSAYVFEARNGTWTQTAKLLASDGRAHDIFGHAVAIDGDRILVGAKWRDDAGNSSGAAYLFERSAGVWRQSRRVNASDARAGEAFGQAVALDGRLLLVGAWLAANTRGAAYLYEEPSLVDANLSTVTADAAAISAYGGTTRIVVTPRKADGSLVGSGLEVQLAASAGRLLDTVLDRGDGSYSQVLAAAPGPAQIVVSATADGVALRNTATVTLITVSADTSTVDVDPTAVTAGESAMVTVVPRSASGAVVGAGLTVVLSTTLGELVGTVSDRGDGTYTQRLDTAVAGTAEITATVNGIPLVDRASLLVRPRILGRVVGFRADASTVLYPTIQEAVRRAPQHRLVRIVVAPGRHDEVVRVHDRHDLRLEAIPSLGLTTIRGLRIWKSSGITVDGFTIDATGGCADGIAVHRSASIALRHLAVRGARDCGLVIGHRSLGVRVERCLFETNHHDGIRVRHHTRGTHVLHSILRHNGGAGIHVDARAEARIEHCQIHDNGQGRQGKGQRGRSAGTGYGVLFDRGEGGKGSAAAPQLVTLIRNRVHDNRGRVVDGRSNADFGNYHRFIDATDDQPPFQR